MAETTKPTSTVANLEARIAQLETLLAAQAPPKPRVEGELSPERKALREQMTRPLAERAQEAADKAYQGTRRFACFLINELRPEDRKLGKPEGLTPEQDAWRAEFVRSNPGDPIPMVMKDCPQIKINGNSPEEAKARYHELNGIRHSERPTIAQPAAA